MPDWLAIIAIAVACLLVGFAVGQWVGARQVARAWQRYLTDVMTHRAADAFRMAQSRPAAPPEPSPDGQEARQPVETRRDRDPQEH